MQKLITKYGLAAHLAIVAVAPLFLSPIPTVILSVLALVWLLMEPSRIGNEMLHDARARVGHALIVDPLFWILLVLIVVAGVRAANGGIAMAYDVESASWSVGDSLWPFLPGAIDGAGLPILSLACAALVTLSGCRHALGRSARQAFVLLASFLTGAVALVKAFLALLGDSPVWTEIACGVINPAYLGFVFGIWFVAAVIALCCVFERRWWRSFGLVFVAVFGNAVGLCLFAPASTIAVMLVLLVIILLYTFLYLRVTLGGTTDFRHLALFGITLALAGFVVTLILPEKMVELKETPFTTGEFLSAEFCAAREALSRLSLAIWKENPWLGGGLGSYALRLQFAASPADWAVIDPQQAAPLNGYWLLLAERGVIGAFMLLVPLCLMVVTYVRRLVMGGLRELPHPLAVFGPFVIVTAVVLLLVDGSALMPSALMAVSALFAISAQVFPKEKKNV